MKPQLASTTTSSTNYQCCEMKMRTILNMLFMLLMSLIVSAITKSRAADVLNLNGIEDSSDVVTERGVGPRLGSHQRPDAPGGKDASGTATQENRSFFKPDADRRGGSFYPSGPPLSSGPNYHTSGTGYSYGAPSGPSADYPPPTYHSLPARPSVPGPGFGAPGHPLLSLGGGPQHAMMLKGLLLPIAGVALLGAAAVLAKSNPVLLQLGVVSGKRRRRSLRMQHMYPQNPYVTPK